MNDLYKPLVKVELYRLVSDVVDGVAPCSPAKLSLVISRAKNGDIHPSEIAALRPSPSCENRAFPDYVSLPGIGAAHLASHNPNRPIYYRRIGEWTIAAQWDGEKLMTIPVGVMADRDQVEMVPCTHQEYMESNGIRPMPPSSNDDENEIPW